MTTYKDLLELAIDYLGANPGGDASRDARRAVLNAIREFSNAKRWVYYYTHGRVVSNPPQNTGTIAYDHTGGTYERMVTLAGATWPTYANRSSLVINNIPYEVDKLKSSTVLTLTAATNPGADVAALTAYNLYQDTYPLPADCLACDRMILQNNAFALWYENPGLWLERQRVYHTPAVPRTYTFTGSNVFLGSLEVRFFPAPDNQYCFDFIYQRRPRPLRTEDYHVGSVAVTSSSATVTGTGTAWTQAMIGSVIRLSADGVNLPTSTAGNNQPLYERIINSVESATSLTADDTFDQTLSGLKYRISDPVDIEDGAMLTALERCIEMQVGLSRDRKTADRAMAMYKQALVAAMEADARNFSLQSSGPSHGYPYRLAQMPSGPDVS